MSLDMTPIERWGKNVVPPYDDMPVLTVRDFDYLMHKVVPSRNMTLFSWNRVFEQHMEHHHQTYYDNPSLRALCGEYHKALKILPSFLKQSLSADEEMFWVSYLQEDTMIWYLRWDTLTRYYTESDIGDLLGQYVFGLQNDIPDMDKKLQCLEAYNSEMYFYFMLGRESTTLRELVEQSWHLYQRDDNFFIGQALCGFWAQHRTNTGYTHAVEVLSGITLMDILSQIRTVFKEVRHQNNGYEYLLQVCHGAENILIENTTSVIPERELLL